MQERPPGLEEWKELYDATIKFKDLAPWNWMYDSDVFGVKNPSTGEVGYCCVLGRVYGTLGFVLYPGPEGLRTYTKTQLVRAQKNLFKTLLETRAVTCLFGSREELHKRDLEVIKSLGLRFRGRDAWPIFRSYRPGYYPWFLTSDEARYLTLALEQCVEVATRFREDPAMLNPPKPGYYFVRVPIKQDGKISWVDSWLEPEPIVEAGKETPIDRVRLKRALKGAKKTNLHLEADLFSLPDPVMGEEDERPFFPRMALWVDQDSGMAVKFDLFKVDEENVFSESLLRLVETLEMIPSEVHLARKDLKAELATIANLMGIRLTRERRLGTLEGVRRELLKSIGGRW